MSISDHVSRREFLKRTSSGTAVLAAPYFVPSHVLAGPGRPGANDRVVIGLIGTGGRARQLMNHMPPEGHMVAACDCEIPRIPTEFRGVKLKAYQDHRQMLDKEHLDAVVVAT
ncbi:MAG: twin-arginine translocation signal domain-containing protein, partial [Pirellulales bacterium]